MVKYELEIITSKGNKFREGGKTLTETRIKACRYAKNEDATVNIRKYETFTSPDFPRQKFGNWKEIEKVWYDPEPNTSYTAFYGGYWVQIRKDGKKQSRRCRLSPKTGRTLDASREWKYI